MRLSARLWLFGAALPVALLAAVLGSADQLYHRGLERGLDQALLSQAAVESVSLFDGPKNEPHLHMSTSPLTDSVRPFAPEGTLFGPDGDEVTRYPPPKTATPRERLMPESTQFVPTLSTRDLGTERYRELVVSVRSPKGEPYALRLSASMAQVDRAASTFHDIALGTTLAAALVLVGIQLWQGRRLRRRLGELHRHLELVHRGELEQVLPPESEQDEIADLRAVLSDATQQLKRGRDAWERLLADAAHELRTPLTLMRTSLDLALRRERSAEELKEALRETRDEVDRLAVLSTRLLDTVSARKAELHKEATDLVVLAQEAVDAARAEGETRGLMLTLAAPPTVHLHVDRGSVRQAIDNLLSNALRFAPVGSSIAVKIDVLGERVALSVSDLGPGIPPAERESVFEPFHRAAGGQRKGAGLGLTIVREVARAHEGKAFVAESEKGATVVLELPLR